MTEETLKARRPVWGALGQLFADTDVRTFYPHILRVAIASPYSNAELERILNEEVVPGLQSMAFSLYPPWSGLDEEWVIGQVEKNLGRRRWLPRFIDMSRDWKSISVLLDCLRALPDAGAREQRLNVWHDLLPLFLDRNPLPREKASLQGMAAYEAAWAGDLVPALMETARYLGRKNPKMYPSELEIEANWREFTTGVKRPG